MHFDFRKEGGEKAAGGRTFTEDDVKAAFRKVSSLASSGLCAEGIDLSKEFGFELFLISAGAAIAGDAIIKGYSEDDIAEKMVMVFKRYATVKVLDKLLADPDEVAAAIKKCRAES